MALLNGKRIVLGVTGSIACYKAIDLASKLTQAGAIVSVIMTQAAQKFVTPLAFRAVTGQPVYTDLWDADSSGGLPTHIAHIGLADQADLIAVIPCTVQHVAQLAHGFAGDLITITVLAARCPVLIAPVGDGNMLANPAVITNLQTLADRGVRIVKPEVGHLASGHIGAGRLPETPTLIGTIRQAFGAAGGSLIGRQVVVTAGGTHEPIDPVRYITNRSSGKQGYAIAQAAIDAGARVTLISTTETLPTPIGVQRIAVETAAQLAEAVLRESAAADALIMAAAVADYRSDTVADQKIKKSGADSGLTLTLVQNPDILAAVGTRRLSTGYPRVLIGFAAETQDLIANAQRKLDSKHADLIIANDVSTPGLGFGAESNRVTVISRDADPLAWPEQSKAAIADRLIGQVAEWLQP